MQNRFSRRDLLRGGLATLVGSMSLGLFDNRAYSDVIKTRKGPVAIDRREDLSDNLPEIAREERAVTLPNGEKLEIITFNGEKKALFFDTELGKFYSESAFKLEGVEVGTLIPKIEDKTFSEVRQTFSDRTYLLFEIADIDKMKEHAFVYFGGDSDNRKIVAGAFKKDGFPVRLIPGNKYRGVDMDTGDNLVIQARGSSAEQKNTVTLSAHLGDNPPTISTRGNFEVLTGNHVVKYVKEEGGGVRNGILKELTFYGEKINFGAMNSPRLKMEFKESNGDLISVGNEKISFEIFTTKRDLIVAYNEANKQVVGKIAFYNLDPAYQTKFLNLPIQKQLELMESQLKR
jgi:hypothetical protein